MIALRVAFYRRISTDEDHQKYSLGAQDDRLRAFCQSQFGSDWQLFKVYRDTESGTHMNRPGLEEMGKAADEWNKTYGQDRPTWRYKGKRMSRDFWRTWLAMVSPPYGPSIRKSRVKDGKEPQGQ